MIILMEDEGNESAVDLESKSNMHRRLSETN